MNVPLVRLVSPALVAVTLCASFALAQDKPRLKTPVDPDAVYNVQSHIYHRESCSAARRCTKNCVVIKLSEAKKRGGRACQICGGPPASQPGFDAGVTAVIQPAGALRWASQ